MAHTKTETGESGSGIGDSTVDLQKGDPNIFWVVSRDCVMESRNSGVVLGICEMGQGFVVKDRLGQKWDSGAEIPHSVKLRIKFGMLH